MKKSQNKILKIKTLEKKNKKIIENKISNKNKIKI